MKKRIPPYFFCILEYELAAEKKSCSGGYTKTGSFDSPTGCAESCKGKASMFEYGRQGTDGCPGASACLCYCFTDSSNGRCTKGQYGDANYDLYRFTQGSWSLTLTGFCSIYIIV